VLEKRIFVASVCVLAVAVIPMVAWAEEPIRIGVIAETSAISGASIPNAAQLAADEINAAGGVGGRKIELVTYDDHNSSAEAVRAFQRASSQDHVQAVIASYVSEVVLALQPWSGRLKLPLITPGASSDVISENIHKDYAKLRYSFHGYLTSGSIATLMCDSAADLLVKDLKMKSTVIFSEDAAWTTPLDAGYEACMPKIGIKVLDHIRFSADTTDFTPIFNKIEGEHPDVIMTGISHVGVQPTVQWASQQVPVPMFGVSSQATTTTFWKDTNGAAEGVVNQAIATPDVALSPKTIPFAAAYLKRFGASPSYCGYTSYDAVYYIADAIKRAGSTDPDKLVDALEHTDWLGTIGRIQFLGKDDPHAHTIRTGAGYVTGLMTQWHNGVPVAVWPASVANARLTFPAFVKLPAATN